MERNARADVCDKLAFGGDVVKRVSCGRTKLGRVLE